MKNLDRREFIGASAAAALAAVATGQDSKPATGAIPTIKFGETGRILARLGIGCYPLGNIAQEDEAITILRRAFAEGIRYIDTAPSYNNGVSERRVGIALKEHDRTDFFVATKTLERTASGARKELEESLKRLNVQYIDCVQVHEVHDDWKQLNSKDSVLTGLAKAKEEKLVRHIGITCHRNPEHILAATSAATYVTSLVPVNPIDPQHRSFVKTWLHVAKERKIAVIAMKIFGGGKLATDKRLTPRECLEYAWSQPNVTVIVPGVTSIAQLEEALSVSRANRTLSESELSALEKKAGPHRGSDTEWYKEA